MDHLFIDVFTDYLIVKNLYNLIGCWRLVCLENKNITDSNVLFKRKKSAEMLKKTLTNLTDGVNLYDFADIILNKADYKHTINSIYNIGTSNDYTYIHYKYKILDYRNDKFHPLKGLRLFKYFQFKKQINASIHLNMALDHAEKPYSIMKARAIDDYTNEL